MIINSSILSVALKNITTISYAREPKKTKYSLVHFDANKLTQTLTLTTQSKSNTMQATINNVEIAEDIQTSVHAVVLNNVAKKIKKKSTVQIAYGQNFLKLVTARTKCILPVIPFNVSSNEITNENNIFVVESRDLYRLLSDVYYAASRNDLHSNLQSIYLHTDDNHLVAIATNSYRLAKSQLTISSNVPKIDAIIDISTAKELIRLLKAVACKVGVSITNKQIQFKIQQYTLVANLLQTKYPEYKKAISDREVLETIELSVVSLLHAVNLVSTICDEYSRAVRLVLIKDIAQLIVNTTSGQFACDQHIILPLVVKNNFTAVYNVDYLVDALQSIKASRIDVITMQFIADSYSIIITSKNNETIHMLARIKY